jgi:hypothetical protein
MCGNKIIFSAVRKWSMVYCFNGTYFLMVFTYIHILQYMQFSLISILRQEITNDCAAKKIIYN